MPPKAPKSGKTYRGKNKRATNSGREGPPLITETVAFGPKARGLIEECLRATGGARSGKSRGSAAPVPALRTGASTAAAAAPVDNAADIKAELARLDALGPQRREMLAARSALPAHQHRDALLSAIAASPVCLVRGATGCGKSTQLPQLILEDAAASGRPCHVVVAQPRRLAATALADRVHDESGDGGAVGSGLVGYQIRGESKVCGKTAITFMTTGILLRRLETPGALAAVTHVLVDEVHERSADSDMLLLVLQRAFLASRQREGEEEEEEGGGRGGGRGRAEAGGPRSRSSCSCRRPWTPTCL